MIDLPTKTVITSFTAGTVDLENIDTEEEGIIDQTSSLAAVPREPDGVTWISTEYFVTADEGDMDGGSRGFTIFDKSGNVVAGSGSEMDQLAASYGHYPEERSGNKGSEPENVAFGTFGGIDYLFVNAERSNLVFVYNINNVEKPKFYQVLPTSVGPEGALTIPSRNLLVVACEKDDRGDAFRSTLSIYEYGSDKKRYPTIMSLRDEGTGVAIPWSAMSGLSRGHNKRTLYAVEDSFYASSRFFTIDISRKPYIVSSATNILDSDGVLASIATDGEFTDYSLADMINDDGTVNLDPEGIARDNRDGSLWIVSEGKGTKGEGEEITSINLILNVDADTGVIKKVVQLPDSIADAQLKWGLEGIAYVGGRIVVCLQRAWQGMTNPKILVYDIDLGLWTLVVDYPLDAVESSAGGWVGLADITSVGKNKFYVLERDNQGNKDAAVKRVYCINLKRAKFGDVLSKKLVVDLLPTLQQKTQGLVPEKIEGLAWINRRNLYLINDNDGVDDNNGETNLWNLATLL